MLQKNPEKMDIHETPRKQKLRQWISRQKNLIKKQKMQIKNLQKNTSRYRKKIASLKDIVDDLKEKNYIGADHVTQLANIEVSDLMQRCKENVSSGEQTNKKYSPSLRIFACTLLLAKGVRILCEEKIPNSSASCPNNKKMVSVHRCSAGIYGRIESDKN